MNPFRYGLGLISMGFLSVATSGAAERGSLQFLGADPQSPRVHWIAPATVAGQLGWQELPAGDPGRSLLLARRQLGSPAQPITAGSPGSLADLLARPAGDFGLPRHPLRIQVVRVHNRRDKDEQGYLAGFERAGFDRTITGWRQAGVRVETTEMLTPDDGSGAPEIEAHVGRLLAGLDKEAVQNNEAVALPVVIVLWAENRLKFAESRSPSPLGALPPNVVVVNVANAMLPPLDQRGSMRRLAAARGWIYDEVKVEASGQGPLVRQWAELGERVNRAVQTHYAAQRILTITSDLVAAAPEREFAVVQGAGQARISVRLSRGGQAALQRQALGALESVLQKSNPASSVTTALSWLPVFDGATRPQAEARLSDFVKGGAVISLFKGGQETEALKLVDTVRQTGAADLVRAARQLDADFDQAREMQFGDLIRAGNFAAAETRWASVTVASRKQRLGLDLWHARGLARARGDQFADGLADLDRWHEEAGEARSPERVASAGETVIVAAVAQAQPSAEVLGRWFGRLRSVQPNLTPAARASAGRWLGAAGQMRELWDRAARLGDLRLARDVLRPTAGDASAWLDFTLGDPAAWRDFAAREAGGSPAAFRLFASLTNVEGARPVAETFAALHARWPAVAAEALAAAHKAQIQGDWRERNPVAEIVALAKLPFPSAFIALARQAGHETLVVQRETTGPNARVWFDYYRLLGGDSALRLELVGGMVRSQEQTAEPFRRAGESDRGRLAAQLRFIALRDGVMMAAGFYAKAQFQAAGARDLGWLAGPDCPLVAGVPAKWRSYLYLNTPTATGPTASPRPGEKAPESQPPQRTVLIEGAAVTVDARRELSPTDFILPVLTDQDGTQRAQLGVALYEPRTTADGKTAHGFRGTLRLGLHLPR